MQRNERGKRGTRIVPVLLLAFFLSLDPAIPPGAFQAPLPVVEFVMPQPSLHRLGRRRRRCILVPLCYA
ncbi:MAG: hypothetical protein QHI48_04220 [Bacteroidota bacterium]|nr:hypothetical protein [Bacteroidota bacterium]